MTSCTATTVAGMYHPVGAAEIGRMLGGVSRQRVQQIVKRADFPAPEVELDMGKVWSRAKVEAWLRAHGRDVADDPERRG